jgi:hypothetical protein
LDADDELRPIKIENQVEVLKEFNNLDLVIAPYENRINNSKQLFLIRSTDHWTALIIGRAGYTSSNLFSKKIIEQVGGWDVSLNSSQETRLMFKIFQNTIKIQFSEQIETIKYERISGSISYANRTENWVRAIKLRLDIKEYLLKNSKLTVEREQGVRQIVFDCIRNLYYEDAKLAIEYYKQLVKNKYTPKKSLATSQIYILFYFIFGFEKAQRFFTFIRRKRMNY